MSYPSIEDMIYHIHSSNRHVMQFQYRQEYACMFEIKFIYIFTDAALYLGPVPGLV